MTHAVGTRGLCTAEPPMRFMVNSNLPSLAQWCVDMANELAGRKGRASEATNPSEEPTDDRRRRPTELMKGHTRK